ncbi:MAG: DUF5719 family protein [Acidimicrobiia bacterium]|nr:DUF5719 family protein [Acidimicrobiia bacterium]
MSRRAIPALVLVIVGFIAIVYAGRESPVAADPEFSAQSDDWMPAVSENRALTGSWFCPGVPVGGEEGVGGEVVVSNRFDDRIEGTFTILTDDGVGATGLLTIEAWSQSTIDVDAFVTTPFAAVVVELDGGLGFVEQRAEHPAGDSVAPCANAPSSEWYFADGFTVDGSIETLILSNPYDDAVVADLAFATLAGESTPAAFQGFTIPPQSVKTVRIAELGARDEPIIATQVTATSGLMVVGRAQHYLGGGRLGYDVSLGSPALRDQYWFADGERGDGISESYSIYNPTDHDVDVDVIFLGLPVEANFGDVAPIIVPARAVVVFDPYDEVAGASIPDGRHAAVFSAPGEPSIVVERVITRPAGEQVATSVVLGAPPRPDGYVATRWHVGIGPGQPTEEALVIYNVDNVDASITIEAVGPAGPSAVPSLTDIPIGPGAVLAIDLTADGVIGQELIISSTNRMFVERLLPRGAGRSGRSGSSALPAS